jgi:hypothetical protein
MTTMGADQAPCCSSSPQLVEFGREILEIVPGRVSTEVDASLSFDKAATKAKVSPSSDTFGVVLSGADAVYRPTPSLPSTRRSASPRTGS